MSGFKISTGGWKDYDIRVGWIPACGHLLDTHGVPHHSSVGSWVPGAGGWQRPIQGPLMMTYRVSWAGSFRYSQPDVQWELLCSYSLWLQSHCNSEAQQHRTPEKPDRNSRRKWDSPFTVDTPFSSSDQCQGSRDCGQHRGSLIALFLKGNFKSCTSSTHEKPLNFSLLYTAPRTLPCLLTIPKSQEVASAKPLGGPGPTLSICP